MESEAIVVDINVLTKDYLTAKEKLRQGLADYVAGLLHEKIVSGIIAGCHAIATDLLDPALVNHLGWWYSEVYIRASEIGIFANAVNHALQNLLPECEWTVTHHDNWNKPWPRIALDK